jgi:hypothetical protein
MDLAAKVYDSMEPFAIENDRMAAALILYRVAYYLVPLAGAALTILPQPEAVSTSRGQKTAKPGG